MAITAEQVVIEIIAKVDRAKSDIKSVDGQFDTSAKSMERATKSLEGHFERLATESATSFGRVGQSAKKAAGEVDDSTRKVANAQRNLGRQFADVGAQLSGGQSPFLIAAQQAPQVADALADMGGRGARVAAFFAGPLGAALLGAASVALTLGREYLSTSDATETMTAAQIDLARFVDTATGAINRQTTAIQRLAAAQARQADVENGTKQAVTSRSRAIGAVNDAAGVREPVFTAGFRQPDAVIDDPIKKRLRDLAAEAAKGKQPINDFALAVRKAVGDRPEYRDLVKTVTAQAAAAVTAAQGVQRLKAEQALLTGTATAQQKALLGLGLATTGLVGKQVALATATTTLEKARARLALVEEGGRSIAAGDTRALAQYRTDLTRATQAVNAAEAAEKAAAQGKRDRAKADRDAARAAREREKAARLAARAERDLLGLRGDLAGAKSDLTSDTRLQDQFARQRINLDRAGRLSVEDERLDRGELTRTEYAARKSLIDEIADARLDIVNRNESIRTANEQLAAAQANVTNQQDVLSAQAALATTAKARREIELKLLDLAIEEQRLTAQKVVDLAAAGKAGAEEGALARARLDVLPQLRDLGAERINRDAEGPLAQYGRQLRDRTGDMNASLEGVAVDGLGALEDGFAGIISGTTSVSDAFSRMADNIIADLARIAIQQALVKLLPGVFGGTAAGGGAGAAGGIGGFLSGLFGRASGGRVEAGQLVRVNEAASVGRVEAFRPQGSGEIIPLGRMNDAIRPSGGGVTVVQQITLDARGAITTREFVQSVNSQMQAVGRDAVATATSLSRKGLPAASARLNALGTS